MRVGGLAEWQAGEESERVREARERGDRETTGYEPFDPLLGVEPE